MQINWSDYLNEERISHFVEKGFLVIDHFFDEDFIQQLTHWATQNTNYTAAKLVNQQSQSQIRSDSTCWLEYDHGVQGQYLTVLERLIEWLNENFYLGIKRAEAHFAKYQAGQFYLTHSDNPKGSCVRAVSVLTYLNPCWQAEFGGELILTDRQNQQQRLLPIYNRLAMFDSNLLHEVKPATQTRYSVTAWLRRDEA